MNRMSRFAPLTLCVLLTSTLLLVPRARTQEPNRASLPSVADYAPAGPTCRIKRTVYAHVSSRAVVFGKTTECSLLVHSCKPKPELYRSDARPTKQDVCQDYYAAAAELTGRRTCCDRGEPEGKKEAERKSGGEKQPQAERTSEDEGKDEGGIVLDADLAVSINAPAKYPLGITPFAVTVVNKGPGPATAARLTGSITLSRLNSATTSQGKCSVNGGGFSCDLGTIANSESRSVSLQARTEKEGRAEITADVRSGTPDRITENNHARAAIEVKKAVKGTWSSP